jgi:hypothetical protein
MPEDSKNPEQESSQTKEKTLPAPWQRIQSAIWLLGLAVLAWQDWWWPGILVLVAISGLAQAGIQLYLSRQEEQKQQLGETQKLAQERAGWIPDVCPNCGGPLSVSTVNWTGPATADCPYCKANLKKPA